MTSSTYISDTNVLDHLRIDTRALHNLHKQLVQNSIKRGVLEPTLASLRQRRPDGKRDYHIVRILRGTVASVSISTQSPPCYSRGSEARRGADGTCELRNNLTKALSGHCDLLRMSGNEKTS